MSSLAFPLHDPKNIVSPFLQKITPLLKVNFSKVFISLTPPTIELNSAIIDWLKADNFFILNFNSPDTNVGDHFFSLFTNTVANSSPNEIIHLCTVDRLAFAILNFQKQFLSDIKAGESQVTLFTRSALAWSTHPQTYYAAESMVSRVGEVLFGKSLDFAWCHITLSSAQLKQILPKLSAHDLVIFAQLVYQLKDILQAKDIDWLSWEDPFIFGKDPKDFKLECEQDSADIQKRFNYVLPMINYLFEQYQLKT